MFPILCLPNGELTGVYVALGAGLGLGGGGGVLVLLVNDLFALFRYIMMAIILISTITCSVQITINQDS